MCGIAGILSKDTSMVTSQHVKKMTDVISHRGPDGEGQWISASGEIGLGHRRLSIIDLSHEADQPMHYLGRYSIVFNGEIYNYIELREQLIQQGYTFKTQSDTEVLMALYDRDKENCLPLLDGMFSMVLYDAQENTVFCARDRFGEKPFFYSYEKGKHFYYGSEMKCLWAGGIPKEVNNKMLFNYLAYGFLDNPNDLSETFYNNCTRLPHSHYAKIKLDTFELSIHRYYDINWKNTDKSITESQAQEKFSELFYTSVKRRLRSDVTVGSSLSGGLDSSLVVCVIDELKKGTTQKQNTFSAVFPGFKKDERRFMDMVTSQTNVEPHYVTPTDEGMIKDIDKVAYHQEEPFGSASIYVQYCVMQMAKENNVTVLLDGQGADEVLAGYHPYYVHYFNELKKNNSSKYKKELAEYFAMHAGSDININVVDGWKNKLRSSMPSQVALMRKMYEKYKHLKNPFIDNDFFNTYFKESFNNIYEFETLNQSLYSSTMEKGLQELLRYADRNSMAHSREVRLPFLSHEVVDFLFTLPSEFKIKDGWTKWIMRNTFKDLLPKDIAWRKDKIGYEPPQKNWMENEDIKNKILSGRNDLTSKGILSAKMNKHAYQAEEALQGDNKNWKFLMTQNLFK
jgi:asparagine synthase (glutamine-hydrolysing)